MKIHSYNSTDAFSELKSEWNDLLKRSTSDVPFNTWEWHYHWWHAYQPGRLWILSCRDENDTLLGIASLFIETRADGQRAVHFVGCEDVTDYLDLVVDKDFRSEVYEAFVTALIDNQSEYDVLDLCNIPETSPTHTAFVEALQAQGFTVEKQVQEICPVIELPETFPDYLKSLDKKQRKELVRKIRVAEAQGDSVSWYKVDQSHDLQEEMEKFLKLMAASHPEKEAFLQDESNLEFFNRIVPAAHEAGWLELNFLVVTGDPVAAYLNFDYNNRILVYNSGLDPMKAAALSPGIVLLAYNIQDAIEHERDIFDFLRGDEDYKFRMGGQPTEVFNVRASLSV